MPEETRQPRPDDAVLGGAPVDLSSAAILGGIEGVKLSLQSGNESARLTALPKALNYGEAGLDLVINALEDPDLKLKAYQLLRKRTEPQASQAIKGLKDYHFYQNLKTLKGHRSSVLSVAITPDGQYIVSGSDDKTIKIWDINTGECLKILEGHTDSVRSVAIIPDGQSIVSSGGDSTIKIWDISTGECLKTLEGHTEFVRTVAITPDGQSIVSGGDDAIINIWNINTGECLKTLEGHTGWVWSVAITPDGQSIVSGSGSDDKTIKIWGIPI